jgi:hypothetical protein
MNSEELKEVLKSKANKLAIAAIDLIQSGGLLEDLAQLVAAGCADSYVERDPSHPRSRFLTHHVLDTCFDTHFDIVKQTEGEGVFTTVLGEVHHSEGREPYFKLLLDAGFKPGTNGWRGRLFEGILNECFYPDHMTNASRRETAKRFARLLIDSGRFDLQHYANTDYHWTGSLDKLAIILAFGANPAGPGMIDRALSYIACAPNSGEAGRSRADVIHRLLELGAVPQEKSLGSRDKRYQIETFGLLEKLAAFGVIELEQPPAYLEYLDRHGYANPRWQLAGA